MLKDIRQGAVLYILDKKNRVIGNAEVMQNPVLMPPQFQYGQNGMIPQRQTMSLRIKYNGKESVLGGIYADVSSTESIDGSQIVICESKDALVSELKAFKIANDNIVENVDMYRDNSAWCDTVIAELDPVKQAEVQNAKQIEAIKDEFREVLKGYDEKFDKLTAALEAFVNKAAVKED